MGREGERARGRKGGKDEDDSRAEGSKVCGGVWALRWPAVLTVHDV